MDILAVFAKRSDASIDETIAGIQRLNLCPSKEGKENASHNDSVARIQECLKAAQKRLAQPKEDVQQLASLCQNCLRLLEQHAGAKMSTKLHTLAYTTIRLLISAKAFAPALEEALRLHQSLSKELKANTNKDAMNDSSLLPTSLSTDILNLAVGAILTMALCFAEGAVKDSKQLSYVLSAAEIAQNWFRLLPAQESAKHSQTLFKSLYRGSSKLFERKEWESLQGACVAMVSENGDGVTSTVPMALGATAKLAAHVPEPYSVHLLSKVILSCPSITSSISLLEGKQSPGGSSSMSTSAAAALEVLRAALGAGNSLRKRVATLIRGPTDAIIGTLGGEGACLEAAATLDVVASIISIGHKQNKTPAAASSVEAAASVPATDTPPFSDYAHSAAVALACSARIRSACIHKGVTIDWENSYTLAVERVLGWQWPNFHSSSSVSSQPPSPRSILSFEELVWLSSSLYNAGIDLLTRNFTVASSIEPLTASLAASVTALSMLQQPTRLRQQNGISDEEENLGSEDSCTASAEISQGIQDVIKRGSVLIEALGKAGKEAAVLTMTAADVLAAVCTACPEMSPSSAGYSTMVNSLVSTTIKQQISGTTLLECPPSVTKRRGGRVMKSATAPTTAALTTSSSQSLTAAVQNHRGVQISETFVAMVARAELVSWAEALSSGLPPTAGEKAAAAAAAAHLLDAVYPSNTAPLDHARTLILVEQLKLNNLIEDKKNKGTCIERAQHVLRPLVKKGDVEALILDALMAAQGVLWEAQTLVEASIDHQKVLQQEKIERIKRNPSEVHADDNHQDESMSTTTTAAAAFVESQAVKWSSVLRNAQNFTAKLSLLVQQSSSSSSAALFKQEDGKALIAAARELATLVGIHGFTEQEQQAIETLAELEDFEINSNTGGVLLECILPAFDASADGAALEAAATDLAVATTNSRNSMTVMQRAELSMAASLAYAASGAVVQALYCAGEGHRLLGSLVQNSEDGAGAGNTATASSLTINNGWWKLSVSYCRSLLLVGRLFDSAGMMDEGIVALKEGQRMAEAMGSSLLNAAFISQLAQVYAISGQSMAAVKAINSAKNSLESSPSSALVINESIVKQWVVASVACAETRVHTAAGEFTPAMLCCHTAMDGIEEAQDYAFKSAAKPHIDALLAAVHCARLEVLKAEGRESEEIGDAAKEALMHIDSEACIAFGAAPRAELLLTQAAAVAAAAAAVVEVGSEKLSSSSSSPSTARLWVHTATAEANTISEYASYLWQALLCSRGAPHIHRFAAFKLASLVASSGHLHLAALLLHIGAGSTLQLQHQLVLHARERNAQRRQRASASTLVGAGQREAESAETAAAKALNVLDSDLDWELIKSMLANNAGSSALGNSTKQVKQKRGGSKRSTAKPSSVAAVAEEKMQAALATLNNQAAHTLHKWLSALPCDTPVCTVGARDDQDCLVISRLVLAPTPHRNINNRRRETGEQEVVPIIIDIPINAYGTSTSQHPIRALALGAGDEEEKNKGCCSSAVASAVHEMERVLADSTHSMKNMATETRDQQREWWRTRVELDDSLAALLQHLGGEWLGPWKCLLIGPPLAAFTASPSEDAPGESLRERVSAVLEQLLTIAGNGLEIEDRSASLEAVYELAITIVHSMQIMSIPEQRQAATTLCTALLESSRDSCAEKKGKEENVEELKMQMVTKAVKQLSEAAAIATSSSAPVPAAAAAAKPLAAVKKKAAAPPPTTRKVTFFQGENEDEASSSPSSPEPRTQLRQAPSFDNIGIDNSLDDGGAGGSNLCARFDALAVVGGGSCAPMATPLPARTPGAATIRAKKHKSRLALMQGAVTPAAKSARKPLRPITTGGDDGGGFCFDDEVTNSIVPATIPNKNIAAATAPKMPRPLATPATAFTMPTRARNLSSSEAAAPLLNAAPVVAIFSPELQCLPWESAPGLALQQIYRLHALPCAAASASAETTATSHVDLSSAYYTINPSGDLQSTQDTFETWFKGLRGWSGRAGSPPSSFELAHALQSKELFVYCGHGGGEQYIPTAKLRGLPRCAASLLMGCSSGRLRGGGQTSFLSLSSSSSSSGGGKKARQQRYHYYYEPTGVVLAYLLAGCPAAVANLWDVTDRDIDRFAQAVLTTWLGDGDKSSSRGDGDMAAAVAAARGACKLPCLIGAAPVCYGVPTTVTISQ